MNHTQVNEVGLCLILVDTFSTWPEVFQIWDKKSITVKQVLRIIFTRNGVPKTLVTDNAPKFCDDFLCSWLRKIDCVPYKTPPYHPQSNGIAVQMIQTIKM